MDMIRTDDAPAPVGPYSQAVRAGTMIYCSGQIPLSPTTGEMVPGEIIEQTQCVMRNLQAVLEAAGSSLQQIVRTTIYLSDMNDFAAMNGEYERLLQGHKPARATVEVSALPKGAGIEIDCIAEVI